MNIEELKNDETKIEKICKDYYESVDKNKNGVLEFKEIKSILVKFADVSNSIQPVDEDIRKAFNQLDTNKDGKISYSEFKNLFNSYLKNMTCKK